MIDTTHLTVDQLADAWQHIHDASPADEADPLVLECAGRLASDPGGEQAHVWVAGLVAMSGYLAWRPGKAAEQAALDALREAATALDGQSCSHDDHPYEAEMDSLEDEIWTGDNGLLTGELASPDGGTGAERVLCPGNVAGWARLATDMIAPFTVRSIPAGAPKYHHSSIRMLSGVVNDYPYDDPQELLAGEAVCLPDRPTRGVLAGYLVTMNATCWYAASERITDRSVLDSMVKGIQAAVPLLGDEPCAHGPKEHPDTNDPDYANRIGYLLRSPGGRAELAEDYGWDEEEQADDEEERVEAWVCSAFLHELADKTLEVLTDALQSFEPAGGDEPGGGGEPE
ncbi:hypothetical protein ACGFSD_04985 [Streptomyces caniferus]|uniref:hypothetical protein n=1 Tax=Streptomyces caniferus TaxID=285557 RepID=UPI003714E799